MSFFSLRMNRRQIAANSEQGHTESAPQVTFLRAAGTLARGADRVLTAVIGVILILILFYACFALWDTWRIYDRAGIDDSLLQYKPQLIDNSEGFAELMAINPDVCAWLTVDDTHIDYPVVQGSDNVHYVNTDVYGDFSLSGSIFLDFRNERDFSDSYSLIYGHHMDADAMFGELDEFVQRDYFEEHTTGTLYLPENSCDIEWFACLKVDAYDAQIFSPGDFTESEQDALLTYLLEHAVQYREIGVTNENRILALSTCSDTSTNARIILAGRLSEATSDKGGEG